MPLPAPRFRQPSPHSRAYGPKLRWFPDIDTVNYDLGTYRVWSESDPTESYTVKLALRGRGESTCTCIGHTYHGHCKHVQACQRRRRKQEREQSERLAALLERTAPASLYDLDDAPGWSEYYGGAA